MNRKEFLKGSLALALCGGLRSVSSGATAAKETHGRSLSKVYFTKQITPERLVSMYEAVKCPLAGRVAVKIHSGEPGGHHFIQPSFMKPLVDCVKGTIVECNTAYAGRRNTTKKHWQTMKEHGFTDIAKVDIMDSEGELALPVPEGRQIKVNYVGKHLSNYDSMLVLSHFKGQQMGGFGGALKNLSIGVASSHGKACFTVRAIPNGCGHVSRIGSLNRWRMPASP